MKKAAVILCLALVSLFGCVGETQYLENDAVDDIVLREPLPPPPAEPSCIKQHRFRVVSLTQLQAAARAGLGSSVSPNAARNMCGLNTIEGFMVDRQNKDLLIFGKVVDRAPPLLLDDFVVAFRSACKKYAVKNVFTPPGCTIEPTKEMFVRLEALEKRIASGSSSDAKWNTHKQSFEKACKSPHAVKVLGVPSQTHFASILVKADYDMKRVVNGSDPVDIPGVVDLYSLHSYESRKSTLKKTFSKTPKSGLSRFWFKPTEFHFIEQNNLVVLDKFQMTLLTERQYLASDKRLKGKGKADPLAERVADSFNTYFTYISQKRRVFRQLKELMRMYVVLEAMYHKDAHEEGGLNFTYLLNGYKVPRQAVSSSMPGLSRYVVEKYSRETFEETRKTSFVFPMCGGVNFDAFFKWEDFSMIGDGRLTVTFRSILQQKPRPKALYWDVVSEGMKHQHNYRKLPVTIHKP